MKKIPADRDLLPATDDYVVALRSFLSHRWTEYRAGRRDLSGACVVAAALSVRVFGGEIRGNFHHVHAVAPCGTAIDLTEGAGVREAAQQRVELARALPGYRLPEFFVGPDVDPLMHDHQFIGSAAFSASLESWAEMAAQWAQDFVATVD